MPRTHFYIDVKIQLANLKIEYRLLSTQQRLPFAPHYWVSEDICSSFSPVRKDGEFPGMQGCWNVWHR